MKTRKVISNSPTKLPITGTVLYSFLLYYFNVSGIIIGIFATIYAIYWILCIVAIWNEKRVDLFEEKAKEQK